ncbi:aminoacyl-histidine dipeptidase [Candidatus Thorarchaeota archaeon]|nr:MAG: aminoacyl-histidine dipeptidase [Candidatus Thorarchaeota archaeon]
MVLENLQPRPVWDIFENVIAATPRCSKHEEKIRRAIRDWLEQQDIEIEYLEDEVGNILLKVPATKRMESLPSVMIQGHLDMVCESDRAEGFDFENKPIPVRIQDNQEWVDANGTTLGADNGIAIALALALLTDTDEDFEHGPLELLFTVDEETGLTGAFGLDVEALGVKSKYLLNVDSEDLGVITIGSAGGGGVDYNKTVELKDPEDDLRFFSLQVSGLLGGHSGVDIHLHRANANKLVARMLSAVLDVAAPILVSWNGGTKHNAITRDSRAVFGVRESRVSAMKKALKDEQDAIMAYYHNTSPSADILEPNIEIQVVPAEPAPCFDTALSQSIIMTANVIPHGPRRFSPEVPNLVETSCNLAIVSTEGSQVEIHISARGNDDAELDAFRRSLKNLGELGGWHVTLTPAYPGWRPEPKSDFLGYVKKHYEQVMDDDVEVEAIHAGLECGIIGAQVEGMQMVSIGPTIKNPHTPDEKIRIRDVGVIYDLLKSLVASMSDLE